MKQASSGTVLRHSLLALLGCLASGATAAEATIDYSRDIRPILAQNCFTCHGPDEGTREAGLRLDRREGAIETLDSDLRAVVPGHPEQSELLARITSDDEYLQMPPAETGRRLSAAQIDLLRRWIAQGAQYAAHWSFQPLARQEPPAVDRVDWPRNDVDRFILARLEREGLVPSPEADRPTLIRRLSLDLRGLPPSPTEIDAFLNDERPDAYEHLVDRMLNSPHFGERWGRHWLDLARYADSDGYLGDKLRPAAYRYRDWVIDAINRDLPFDQFTIEQLAGDLLDNPTVEQQAATGFHCNAMKNTEAGFDKEADRVIRTVDRVSTVGTVWLGLTVGCAECHSHKFDPISHHEFYQLYAFFDNLEERELKVPDAGSESAETAMMVVPAVHTAASLRETHVHLRGDFRRPGDKVEPGTPAFLPPLQPRGDRADRLDLARWLVDSENPLTPRTAVNHIWKHLFGRGIVETADNLGTSGADPSHPELLDWLAMELLEQGWSRKAVIRQIVTSAAYRQSSRHRPELQERDPLNVLLARQSRFRLEAEIVRDVALSAAGLLNPQIGGPSIRPPMNTRLTEISRNKEWKVSAGNEKYRRGVYILFRRATPYPMLTLFDAPDSSVACAGRERSNSPLQALTLLNDPVFFECAQHLGRRLAEMGDVPPQTWIAVAFRQCLARPPEAAELERLVAHYHQQRRLMDDAPTSDVAALAGAPVPGLAPQEHAARVMVARSLMNLDEFITRE